MEILRRDMLPYEITEFKRGFRPRMGNETPREHVRSGVTALILQLSQKYHSYEGESLLGDIMQHFAA